jgi:GNAT superfamily N-acetyltransferase
MMKHKLLISGLKFYPLTPRRWKDFEELFGERGACGGCWCMSWRLARSQFEKQKGKKNRLAMRKLVKSGQVPGILAYAGQKPVGWCSVAPRESYSSLMRSRFLKEILEEKDDKSVSSITCFFVDKNFRNQGLSIKLIGAAVQFAKKKGAKLVEAYPKQPKKDKWPDAFVWTGHISAFKKCGFVETHRPSPSRPIMRYFIQKTK